MRDPCIGDLIAARLFTWTLTEERVNGWLLKLKLLPYIGWLVPRKCLCGEIRRAINRCKWLHDFSRRLGFRVMYDDSTIW